MEETLNELLNKEAEELTSAAKYERTEARQGYRSGHYSRKLTTTSGEVRLEIPKLKGVAFETAIIERYRRRESSVEEALIEMYLAGVSVRRVEDISEALWGSRVSASTISDLNQKAYVHIEEWRNRKLSGKYPYVYVDSLDLHLLRNSQFYDEMRGGQGVAVGIGISYQFPHNRCRISNLGITLRYEYYESKNGKSYSGAIGSTVSYTNDSTPGTTSTQFSLGVRLSFK